MNFYRDSVQFFLIKSNLFKIFILKFLETTQVSIYIKKIKEVFDKKVLFFAKSIKN